MRSDPERVEESVVLEFDPFRVAYDRGLESGGVATGY